MLRAPTGRLLSLWNFTRAALEAAPQIPSAPAEPILYPLSIRAAWIFLYRPRSTSVSHTTSLHSVNPPGVTRLVLVILLYCAGVSVTEVEAALANFW